LIPPAEHLLLWAIFLAAYVGAVIAYRRLKNRGARRRAARESAAGLVRMFADHGITLSPKDSTYVRRLYDRAAKIGCLPRSPR
jgi:hypothetical protein